MANNSPQTFKDAINVKEHYLGKWINLGFIAEVNEDALDPQYEDKQYLWQAVKINEKDQSDRKTETTLIVTPSQKISYADILKFIKEGKLENKSTYRLLCALVNKNREFITGADGKPAIKAITIRLNFSEKTLKKITEKEKNNEEITQPEGIPPVTEENELPSPKETLPPINEEETAPSPTAALEEEITQPIKPLEREKIQNKYITEIIDEKTKTSSINPQEIEIKDLKSYSFFEKRKTKFIAVLTKEAKKNKNLKLFWYLVEVKDDKETRKRINVNFSKETELDYKKIISLVPNTVNNQNKYNLHCEIIKSGNERIAENERVNEPIPIFIPIKLNLSSGSSEKQTAGETEQSAETKQPAKPSKSEEQPSLILLDAATNKQITDPVNAIELIEDAKIIAVPNITASKKPMLAFSWNLIQIGTRNITPITVTETPELSAEKILNVVKETGRYAVTCTLFSEGKALKKTINENEKAIEKDIYNHIIYNINKLSEQPASAETKTKKDLRIIKLTDLITNKSPAEFSKAIIIKESNNYKKSEQSKTKIIAKLTKDIEKLKDRQFSWEVTEINENYEIQGMEKFIVSTKEPFLTYTAILKEVETAFLKNNTVYLLYCTLRDKNNEIIPNKEGVRVYNKIAIRTSLNETKKDISAPPIEEQEPTITIAESAEQLTPQTEAEPSIPQPPKTEEEPKILLKKFSPGEKNPKFEIPEIIDLNKKTNAKNLVQKIEPVLNSIAIKLKSYSYILWTAMVFPEKPSNEKLEEITIALMPNKKPLKYKDIANIKKLRQNIVYMLFASIADKNGKRLLYKDKEVYYSMPIQLIDSSQSPVNPKKSPAAPPAIPQESEIDKNKKEFEKNTEKTEQPKESENQYIILINNNKTRTTSANTIAPIELTSHSKFNIFETKGKFTLDRTEKALEEKDLSYFWFAKPLDKNNRETDERIPLQYSQSTELYYSEIENNSLMKNNQTYNLHCEPSANNDLFEKIPIFIPIKLNFKSKKTKEETTPPPKEKPKAEEESAKKEQPPVNEEKPIEIEPPSIISLKDSRTNSSPKNYNNAVEVDISPKAAAKNAANKFVVEINKSAKKRKAKIGWALMEITPNINETINFEQHASIEGLKNEDLKTKNDLVLTHKQLIEESKILKENKVYRLYSGLMDSKNPEQPLGKEPDNFITIKIINSFKPELKPIPIVVTIRKKSPKSINKAIDLNYGDEIQVNLKKKTEERLGSLWTAYEIDEKTKNPKGERIFIAHSYEIRSPMTEDVIGVLHPVIQKYFDEKIEGDVIFELKCSITDEANNIRGSDNVFLFLPIPKQPKVIEKSNKPAVKTTKEEFIPETQQQTPEPVTQSTPEPIEKKINVKQKLSDYRILSITDKISNKTPSPQNYNDALIINDPETYKILGFLPNSNTKLEVLLSKDAQKLKEENRKFKWAVNEINENNELDKRIDPIAFLTKPELTYSTIKYLVENQKILENNKHYLFECSLVDNNEKPIKDINNNPVIATIALIPSFGPVKGFEKKLSAQKQIGQTLVQQAFDPEEPGLTLKPKNNEVIINSNKRITRIFYNFKNINILTELGLLPETEVIVQSRIDTRPYEGNIVNLTEEIPISELVNIPPLQIDRTTSSILFEPNKKYYVTLQLQNQNNGEVTPINVLVLNTGQSSPVPPSNQRNTETATINLNRIINPKLPEPEKTEQLLGQLSNLIPEQYQEWAVKNNIRTRKLKDYSTFKEYLQYFYSTDRPIIMELRAKYSLANLSDNDLKEYFTPLLERYF